MRKFSTVSTAFSGSVTRYHNTAFTFTVTLSRVMVSCCSIGDVTTRRSIRVSFSTPSGMSQNIPGPRSPV